MGAFETLFQEASNIYKSFVSNQYVCSLHIVITMIPTCKNCSHLRRTRNSNLWTGTFLRTTAWPPQTRYALVIDSAIVPTTRVWTAPSRTSCCHLEITVITTWWECSKRFGSCIIFIRSRDCSKQGFVKLFWTYRVPSCCNWSLVGFVL